MVATAPEHVPQAFLLALLLALLCTTAAIVLGSRHIYLHLTHYTRPAFQLHIVRILAMVPIYSATASLALVLSSETALAYLALIRDSYEAYVIYNFVALLISYGGGDRQLIYYLEGQPRLPHTYPLSRFLPPMALDATFINGVRLGVLQFIVVKPAVAVAKLKLATASPPNPHAMALHFLMAVVENLSVSSALYGLVIFYHATADILRPHSPLPKFLSVKAVVFFSFWQGIALRIAVSLHVLTDIPGFPATDQATGLHDVLICVEMAIASLVHYYVFSYKEYSSLPALPTTTHHPLLRNFGDIVDFRDVLSDAKQRLAGGTDFESELRTGEPLLPGADRVLGSLSRNSNGSTSSLSYDLASAPWNVRGGTGFANTRDPALSHDDLFDDPVLDGPPSSSGRHLDTPPMSPAPPTSHPSPPLSSVLP
jgi:Organic solute transporter Ostalpha